MASLDELQDRIESAEDLQSIVRVMKSLSAVSINQYQQAGRRLGIYRGVVERGLQAILAHAGVRVERPQAATGPTGLIVMGSDRGLCGRFNEIVVERTRRLAAEEGLDPARTPLLAIGARGAARLEAAGLPPLEVFFQPGSVDGLSRTAEAILIALDGWRETRGIRRVLLLYNAEGKGGRAVPQVETLLPIDAAELDRLAARDWPGRGLPLVEGPPQAAFSALLRERLTVSLIRAGALSLAAEHATRLAAMQAAEKSITERLDDLASAYRRERQDSITLELLDIVAATESMAGSDQDGDPGISDRR